MDKDFAMRNIVLRFDMRSAPQCQEAPRDRYRAAIDMACWADRNTVDVVGLSEHHHTEDGFLAAPLGLAAMIVARTERLQVFVLVGLPGCCESLLIGDLVGERDGATFTQLHNLVRLRVLLLLDEAADIELLRLASLGVRVVRLTGARHAQISGGSSLACAEAIKKLLFRVDLPKLGSMVRSCILDGIVGTGAREVNSHLIKGIRPLAKAHRGTHAGEEPLRFLLAGDS